MPMPIIKWEPFNELDEFIDHRFQPLSKRLGFDFAIDIYEQDDKVIAKMNVPGIDLEHLDISIDQDVLTIFGTREEEEETDRKDYYSKEIRRGAFSRSVNLPYIVDANKAEATYKNGVLVVSAPIQEGSKENSIKVKVTEK